MASHKSSNSIAFFQKVYYLSCCFPIYLTMDKYLFILLYDNIWRPIDLFSMGSKLGKPWTNKNQMKSECLLSLISYHNIFKFSMIDILSMKVLRWFNPNRCNFVTKFFQVEMFPYNSHFSRHMFLPANCITKMLRYTPLTPDVRMNNFRR